MKTEIIIPHLSTPDLDASLALCTQMIREHTATCYDYDVTIDADPNICPYEKWNKAAYASKADVLVFLNNDMLVMPGWYWLAQVFDGMVPENSVATGYLVESGAVAVNAVNVEKDFGRHPSQFKNDECEAFVVEQAVKTPPMVQGGLGWLMPLAIRREFFCQLGGYDTGTAKYLNRGRFPDPLDMVFFDKLARVRANMVRVNSWAYHFQRLSLR
jgi:hypothetical protein